MPLTLSLSNVVQHYAGHEANRKANVCVDVFSSLKNEPFTE